MKATKSRSYPGLNPFPCRMQNGSVVLNEECHCGHLRTEHETVIAFGHGACSKRTCGCQRFTWKRMIKEVQS